MSAVPDPAFSEEIMGKGVAILPTEGRVIAPVDGTVFSVSKSGHAIGIVSDKGAEMLIHIGIDTVKLKGQHFTPHIKAGTHVTVGDLLMEFDHVAIKEAGYETITPVIITNIDQYNEIDRNQVSEVKHGDRLYSLKV
ncbi:PTS system beta-glucoside-specific EIIBCA component [compost metagenome]